MTINGQTSDGYHTFDELYDHRITLWIALCRNFCKHAMLSYPWRSRIHSDGTSFEGWFVLGYRSLPGEQITYHLPDSRWDECNFAVDLDRCPTFDGHTSADVIERLKRL